MAKVPGLVVQGTKYHYRRVVPKELRPLARKAEVWIALHTSDYHRAKRLAREAAVSTDAYFAELRAGQAQAKTPSEIFGRPVTDLDLQLVAKKLLWLREKAHPSSTELDAEQQREYLSRLLTAYDEESQIIGYLEALVKPLARDFCPQLVPNDRLDGSNGIPITIASDRGAEWLKLVELTRRAEIEHVRRTLDRVAGDHGDKIYDPLFADVASFTAPPTNVSKEQITIGALIDQFQTDPLRSDFTNSADKKYIITFRALKAVVGGDCPVSQVERHQCVKVQELLARLPPNLVKRKAYRGLDLPAAAELCAERGDPTLSPGTVSTYTQTLSAFFSYAKDQGVIKHNPADSLSNSKRRTAKRRRSYTVEHLNIILSALDEWSSQRRNTGRFWIPLIALFSGMRMGELVALRLSEISERKGQGWAIQLLHGEERPLKTEGAERAVPIHPVLISLGILDLIRRRREEGAILMFPELEGNTHAERAHKFQRKYSDFQKKKLGIVDAGVSFHSYRHTFRDALRECGVPRDATRALGGWARGKDVEDRYGEGTSFATLSKWMGRVEYPGLDLGPVAPPTDRKSGPSAKSAKVVSTSI